MPEASPCRSSDMRGSGVREHAARPLSRLPDAHRRRGRTRSTSATAAAASTPPGSCAFPGPGASGARRWRPRPGSTSRIRRPPSWRRRRSTTRSLRRCRNLPARPLVLGGCCCAHVGAIRGLAARPGRLGVVWIDAHGDLNTPETSPSGNAWGMPLRMAIDEGAVRPRGRRARRRAQPRPARARRTWRRRGSTTTSTGRSTGCDRVYVAFDCDVLRPGELAVFMPEPGGLDRRGGRGAAPRRRRGAAPWRASG